MIGAFPYSLVVLAKQPRPGRVKTRLTPPLTPQAAADVAAAALADTIDSVDAAPAAGRFLAFDGDADGWLRPGWQHVEQPTGGLDVRLAAAFRHAGGPALLVGMDTPQLTSTHLRQFDPTRFDACLGPADDGGYWALGLRDPSLSTAAIVGVPMSRPDTGARQLQRLHELGLRVQLLARMTDVDTAATARTVAALAPRSRFARAWVAAELSAAAQRPLGSGGELCRPAR